MSWYLEFHANTLETAKQRIEVEDKQNTHFPTPIARSVIATLNSMPIMDDVAVHVKSTGSVSFGGGGSKPHGNSELAVRLIPLIQEVVQVAANDSQTDIEDIIAAKAKTR